MSAHSPRSEWFLGLARRYVRRRLARGLDGFHTAGLDAARAEASRRPLILAANHVAWWDSLLVVALDEALGTEGYALMDAANLARLPFFGWLGALPLDRRHPRAGLRAAAERLARPGCALWMFPQGEQRPAHLRPLGFRAGVALLARWAPAAAVVPVAIQYAFRESPVPAAFADLGGAIPAERVGRSDGAAYVEEQVAQGLARIDRALAGCAAPLPTLVPTRVRGPEQRWGARLLSARGDRRHG